MTPEQKEAFRREVLEEAAKVADEAALSARSSIDRNDARTTSGTSVFVGYTFAKTEAESIAKRIRALAASQPAPAADTAQAVDPGELPEDMRAPLHSLQADLDWLVARIRKEDDEVCGMLKDSIRSRLSQIEEAAYRLNAAAYPAPAVAERVREDRFAGKKAYVEALDVADRLIERAYGWDKPTEWEDAFRKVQKAVGRSDRAALRQKEGKE